MMVMGETGGHGDGETRGWAKGEGRWVIGDGRWVMGDGRWATRGWGDMGTRGWAMGDGRWAMGDGEWVMGDGEWVMYLRSSVFCLLSPVSCLLTLKQLVGYNR